MFRTVDKSSGYLFSTRELRDLVEARRGAMRQEVEQMNANQVHIRNMCTRCYSIYVHCLRKVLFGG